MTNGDLISREALKVAIKKELPAMSNWGEHFIPMLIDNAPTVEAFTKEDMAGAYNEGYACGSRENTRPQGEWLEPYESHIAQECSICHRQMPAPNWFNFCPNCGAKMRKEGAE